MSFREKVQIVVVSVAIALALAAGIYYVAGRVAGPAGPSVDPAGILIPTDDQPIIMAGGSFYIGTNGTAKFSPDGEYLAYREGYRVFRIDVLDAKDNPEMPDVDKSTGYGNIVIVYCKNKQCNNREKDTVTMTFDNRVTTPPVIKIQNDLKDQQDKRIPISQAPRILPTLRAHMRKGWKMISVTVTINTTTTPYDCGDDSECEVVVHTCTAEKPEMICEAI